MFSIESYYSLAIYFLVMMAIGVFAYHKSTSNISDYVLGGRNVSPQVTALSAGASDMSGWMLMGLPGAMFILGVEAVWIAIGLLSGAWLNYTLVAPRLRAYSELAQNSLTLPEFSGAISDINLDHALTHHLINLLANFSFSVIFLLIQNPKHMIVNGLYIGVDLAAKRR